MRTLSSLTLVTVLGFILAVAGCKDTPDQSASTKPEPVAEAPLPPVSRCEDDLDFASCQRLCTAKVAVGCQRVGYLYSEGVGVPASRERAIRYFKMACELGDKMSCAN
jgi:hypothetical protein